jgi:hypothetical protein
LKHTITVYDTITRNEYNEETFTGGNDFFGRFQLKNRLFTNEKGEDIMSDAVVYMDRETTGLAVGTKVVYNGNDYRVVALKEALDDISKVHHYEVWVKKWEA